jgi:hypothetical protein
MKAKEKIAYLKGLMAGLKPRDEDDQKLLLALIDVADSLAEELEEQQRALEEQGEVIEEVADYCDQLEDDMSSLEERFDDLVGDSDDETGMEPFPCEACDDEEEFSSVSCPHCGLTFFCRPDVLDPDEELECPGCGETFPFDETSE